MSKEWKLKEKVPEGVLASYSETHPLLVQLLYNRGLKDKQEIFSFLNPLYEKLHDPFLFKDMRKAVERVWQAIGGGESIVVYSDYDADGITAGAVLMQMFRYLGVHVSSYVPDRFTEGYGLNREAFEKLKAEGASVVITVDCGTNAVDVAEFCNQNGIDLIITDHHEITGEKPQSYALINPKNPDYTYPDDQITGVGVAYKLAAGILSKTDKVQQRFVIQPSSVIPDISLPDIGRAKPDLGSGIMLSNAGIQNEGIDPDMHQDDKETQSPGLRLGGRSDIGGEQRRYIEHWDKWLLDLVAIGTVADCHSLLGENRILVKYGLQVLAKTKWVGLRALFNLAAGNRNTAPYDTYTIGFGLAPRINAAGRLEHARVALNLLLAEDPVTAQQLAQALESINLRRQGLTARIVSEAKEQAALQEGRDVLVLSHPDWHKGVVGLVAGRLASDIGKPVIVLERGEQESTGSARSVGNFDIVGALKATADKLVKFGGHKQAAGLTVRTDALEAFTRALLAYAAEHLSVADKRPLLELEAEITPLDITPDMYDVLATLEPFGIGNPKPRFLLRGASIRSKRPVGGEGQHVQMVLMVQGVALESIGFNLAKQCEKLAVNDTIDIACEFLADSWNGIRKVKLRLVDVRRTAEM